MNAWDSEEFVASVRRIGRKNLLIAALWSEVCLVFPGLQMLEEGFGIYAVEDASGGTSRTAHEAAIRRLEQAGCVSVTYLQILLEFQRDWSKRDHYEAVMEVIKEHCGAYGQGVEYATTMVHKEPASVVSLKCLGIMFGVGSLRTLDFFKNGRTRGFPAVGDGFEIVVSEMCQRRDDTREELAV